MKTTKQCSKRISVKFKRKVQLKLSPLKLFTTGFYSPKRPSPTLMKALNKSALVEGKPRTKHKMFVAKRDFVPTHENRKHDVTTGSNHEFLPYLPLKAGETLVGIGNPEKKENGKVIQYY